MRSSRCNFTSASVTSLGASTGEGADAGVGADAAGAVWVSFFAWLWLNWVAAWPCISCCFCKPWRCIKKVASLPGSAASATPKPPTAPVNNNPPNNTCLVRRRKSCWAQTSWFSMLFTHICTGLVPLRNDLPLGVGDVGGIVQRHDLAHDHLLVNVRRVLLNKLR